MSEFAKTEAELAASYRRLCRFTASLRSYFSAIEAAATVSAGGEFDYGVLLCSCAHGKGLLCKAQMLLR